MHGAKGKRQPHAVADLQHGAWRNGMQPPHCRGSQPDPASPVEFASLEDASVPPSAKTQIAPLRA
jgi:hypothetical protein